MYQTGITLSLFYYTPHKKIFQVLIKSTKTTAKHKKEKRCFASLLPLLKEG